MLQNHPYLLRPLIFFGSAQEEIQEEGEFELEYKYGNIKIEFHSPKIGLFLLWSETEETE